MKKHIKIICPFHKERVASCIVSPTKSTFHCFGCGEGGDIKKLNDKLIEVGREVVR